MATSQPMPEILPGWTVTRGTSADLIDGINSGIDELCGGLIRIAAGNDATGRIIRHRIPPRILQAALKRNVALKKQAP